MKSIHPLKIKRKWKIVIVYHWCSQFGFKSQTAALIEISWVQGMWFKDSITFAPTYKSDFKKGEYDHLLSGFTCLKNVYYFV